MGKETQFKANLLSFSVLRKESRGLRSADSVKIRKRNLKKQSQFAKFPQQFRNNRKKRAFAFSGVDVVDMDGVGGAGFAKRLAGYKDYLIAGLCQLVL